MLLLLSQQFPDLQDILADQLLKIPWTKALQAAFPTTSSVLSSFVEQSKKISSFDDAGCRPTAKAPTAQWSRSASHAFLTPHLCGEELCLEVYPGRRGNLGNS